MPTYEVTVTLVIDVAVQTPTQEDLDTALEQFVAEAPEVVLNGAVFERID